MNVGPPGDTDGGGGGCWEGVVERTRRPPSTCDASESDSDLRAPLSLTTVAATTACAGGGDGTPPSAASATLDSTEVAVTVAVWTASGGAEPGVAGAPGVGAVEGGARGGSHTSTTAPVSSPDSRWAQLAVADSGALSDMANDVNANR